MKTRLDLEIFSRNLAFSRARAKALIVAGAVEVNGVIETKGSFMVTEKDSLSIVENVNPWVSRAGMKLDFALKNFGYSEICGTALDIGSSTGGFTQVMLKYGARIVYAVDVGKNQLHKSLILDNRVRSFEGLNAKDLDSSCFPVFDFIVCDASFISLKKVLPVPLSLSKINTQLVALVKPQFEVGRENVGKGGIVKNRNLYPEVCSRISFFLESSGWSVTDFVECPVLGSDGNTEFFVRAQKKN